MLLKKEARFPTAVQEMSPCSSPKRRLTDCAFSQWDACVKCSRSPRNIFFLGADHMTFEGVGAGGGGMCDFRKKYPADWFRPKKHCKEIPVIQWLCTSGKKLYHQRFGKKKSYANQITHTPLQSQMVGPLSWLFGNASTDKSSV